MLPATRRIKIADFGEILTKGKRFNSSHLLLYICQKTSLKPTQFSFSASKKVAKLASERNKLRRWGYSAVQTQPTPIKPGFYCFFVFKKGVQTLKFQTLEVEIVGLLRSSGVLS